LGAFEVVLDFAVDRHGDVSCFFADDDGDGVGGFGNADGGAVTEAEGAVGEFFLADGKDASGGFDTVVSENDAAVVEGSFGVEDGQKEFLADG